MQKKKKKKKKYIKNYKMIYKKWTYLKMSLLNFNFAVIYIIHKILVLLENNLNYLKDSIFECFFKEEYNRLFLINCFQNI